MRVHELSEFTPIEHKVADNIVKAILIGFAVPAFLTSPFGLYYLVRGGMKYYFRRSDFHREIKRLEKREFITLTKTEKGWLIKLLEKGKKRQREMKVDEVKLTFGRAWDKRWHLFTFDIPEKYRGARDVLRKKLKELGLYNIQRSVFVYPFDCKKELQFISEYYRLAKYTTYAEVISIDIDKELRQHFKL